jgi:hypothetical protein
MVIIKKQHAIMLSVLIIAFANISGASAVSLGSHISDNHIEKHIAIHLGNQLIFENNQTGMGLALGDIHYDNQFFQAEQTDSGLELTTLKKGHTIVSADLINTSTGEISQYVTDVTIY